MFLSARDKDCQSILQSIVSVPDVAETYYLPGIPFITDTKLAKWVNYDLPAYLCRNLPSGIKFITFGTVLEDTYLSDPYVDQKRLLAQQQATRDMSLHYKLNTLYDRGGVFRSKMFIGAMLWSFKNNQNFQMSSGLQFREYHSVQSIAHYVAVSSEALVGCVDISSGDGFRLKDLAISVASKFGYNELLFIDEGLRPDFEIYERRKRSIDSSFGELSSSLDNLINCLEASEWKFVD